MPVEITDRDSVLSEPELRDFGHSLLFATLDAASGDSRTDFWIRRHAMYFGKELKGWYELPDWRIAPSLEEPELTFELLQGHGPPRIIFIDTRVAAIDVDDAIERSLREHTRRLAHAAFFLSLPLRWLPHEPALISGDNGRPMAVQPWRGSVMRVEREAEPFSNHSLKGVWGLNLMWPRWEDSESGPNPDKLRFPQAALSLQRRLARDPRAMSAFDSATRLYHLSLTLPPGFASASTALALASVEALAKGLLEFDQAGSDKARFVAFFKAYCPDWGVTPERAYGRWRSGLFHAGEFARIDGAHAQVDFIDDANEMTEMQRVDEAARRALTGWVEAYIHRE